MDVSGGLTLVETLLKTLGSPIWTKIESILGLEFELEKLKDTITTIQAVLLDADEEDIHQQQHRSHVVRNRLQRLREALYRADDLFDEIATLAHRKKLISGNKVSRELRVFFSCSNQLHSAYNWSEELERIREMLDDIVKDHRFECVQRHPVALEPWRMMKMRHNPRETHSYCEESDIIGREDDKKKVIDMLLGSTSVDKNVSVISIVGIGGLGKTTLAQLIYNDALIQTEFPLRMWVCVSDDFNLCALLQQIIAAAKNQQLRNDGQELNMTMDLLQSSLREILDGKKYLLVLDDIWNEDRLKWHELSVLLEKGGSGSKIIVTTRSNGVADVVGSREIHELGGLSEDKSWELFQRIAFEGENNQTEDDMVKIEKEILCKCRNVPLAIRVVGSLLRGQDRRTWECIKNTDLVNIEQDDNGILPVLKISYYHLPFHLKNCFSYCAVFPKDYKIVKDDLIGLWMAQGFVMPLVGQSLEDAGDDYFNHLLQRCFFQDVEKDELSGEIISCKMHDLIHDVAKEVAGTEILSSNNSTSHFNERTRHFFIDRNTIKVSDDIVSSFNKMKRMRSLLSNISFSKWDSYLRPRTNLLVSEMRYLRVLILHCIGLVKHRNLIGQLMHLRYLDLSYNYFLTMLPESITKLYNLQTLKLCHCRKLQTLPRDLSKLVNLRNLDIFGCTNLRYMPSGMNKMTSLHKLTGFVLSGTKKTSQWRSHCVGELGDLVTFTNHADILLLMVDEDARYDTIQAKKLRNLMHKQHLREIKIMWRADNDKSEGNTNPEVLLEGLESCQNLSQIFLEGGYKRSVPCLEHLPRLNHLCNLKVLKLHGLINLKYVESSDITISEDGATMASRRTEDLVFFPFLEELQLINLPKLKGWWKTTSESDSGKNGDKQEAHNQLMTAGMHFNSYSFPRLTFLNISECPELKTIPCCPNLENLNLKVFNGALTPIINQSRDARLSSSCNDVKQGGLRKVQIDNAGYLNYVPLESFHRLSDVTIKDDDKTESLTRRKGSPSDHLCCLRSLSINCCFELKRLSWEGFWEHCTALETLELIRLDVLELEDEDEEEEVKSSSRDGDEGEIRKEVTPWRFLSHSLRHLTLDGLPKLEKLPNGMRHLTSLQFLQICYCSNLKSMSEEMRHLTSLQQLTLRYNSTELNERCKKPSGADWPNIQHIPKIQIE
ncbi:unnamed protein product [Amaranthus hypochondriacus]